MAFWHLTLPLELEIASDSARRVEDEVLIVESNVAGVLEVPPLTAVPLQKWRSAATGVFVHEAH
jgi:hypothetical protein